MIGNSNEWLFCEGCGKSKGHCTCKDDNILFNIVVILLCTIFFSKILELIILELIK